MIPASWLPAALMKRVHLHWTGGARSASSLAAQLGFPVTISTISGGEPPASGDGAVVRPCAMKAREPI